MYDLRDFTTADDSDIEYLVLGHCVYAKEIYGTIESDLSFVQLCVYTLPTARSFFRSGVITEYPRSSPSVVSQIQSRRANPAIQDYSVHRNVSISTLWTMPLPHRF